MDKDQEHLRLLSIFYYIVGGLTILMACFGLLYIFIGFAALAAPQAFTTSNGAAGAPPVFVGWVFIGMGAVFVILGWAYAALTIYAGRCLAQRKRYMFCMVMACISCLSVPFGTILGVFTILVLMRPTVKALFNGHVPPQNLPAEP